MARKSIQKSNILISYSETETDEDLIKKKRVTTSNSGGNKSNSGGNKQNSLSNLVKPSLKSVGKNKSPSTSSLEKRKERVTELSSEETETEDDLIEKKQPSSSLKKGKEGQKKSKKRGRPAGKSSSSSREKRHRKSHPSWMTNWIMRPKTRASNGRIDRTYIHKVEPVTCRSLKEAERYELHGVFPSRCRTTYAKKKIIEKSRKKKQTKEKDAKKKRKQLHIDGQ